MNKSPKSNWHGLAALVLATAIMFFFGIWPTSVSRWIWLHLPKIPESVGFVFWWFVWWPPVLVLAVSGLWRGNTANKICAVLAICLAAGIVLIMCMPGL
jgi:hypothetical protein